MLMENSCTDLMENSCTNLMENGFCLLGQVAIPLPVSTLLLTNRAQLNSLQNMLQLKSFCIKFAPCHLDKKSWNPGISAF